MTTINLQNKAGRTVWQGCANCCGHYQVYCDGEKLEYVVYVDLVNNMVLIRHPAKDRWREPATFEMKRGKIELRDLETASSST
jgi:hypothetical protein